LGFRMIGSEEVCVEKIPSRSRFQVHSLQVGKMGRTAYWKGAAGSLACLYWAMRAACPVPGLVARGEH
jgi:hypothetical protein